MERKILIADDHAIVRYGVSLIIREEVPGSVITEVDNFNDALSLVEKEHFHLLILDINLPGGNSIQMLDQIRQKQPSIKILVFTAYEESTFAIRYMQAGADGYLIKNSAADEIGRALRTVLSSQLYVSDSVKESLLADKLNRHNSEANPLRLLSNRENDVLQLMLQGKSVSEIANMLNVHTTTISTYKNRIFEKMNTRNLVELIEKYRLFQS
ncbi:response regulator transcription factor [Sediminibacterium ginsengisoli]|uniref:DNA-binding response regulator, NarL/FixJ family, contains REC and HTH domains n=1 Tax=Sediminibacterium ginsengisoli TaxID=413434 RepID=A0A1T4MD29_9BACT|nr:response regulator transcription factor [Sediminibacterium ginsengisoli]SJZ64853.1 DNA-binding response regulator, NarL/FixJ family, contains REC and HTH domains [Sediminibacterium ginsengisoli]